MDSPFYLVINTHASIMDANVWISFLFYTIYFYEQRLLFPDLTTYTTTLEPTHKEEQENIKDLPNKSFSGVWNPSYQVRLRPLRRLLVLRLIMAPCLILVHSRRRLACHLLLGLQLVLLLHSHLWRCLLTQASMRTMTTGPTWRHSTKKMQTWFSDERSESTARNSKLILILFCSFFYFL